VDLHDAVAGEALQRLADRGATEAGGFHERRLDTRVADVICCEVIMSSMASYA
jgi:hypothetical protein